MHSPSSVQRARPTKAVTSVGDWTKTPLCVRYAELLRLRQAVLKMEVAKSSRDSRIDLKKRVTMRFCGHRAQCENEDASFWIEEVKSGMI